MYVVVDSPCWPNRWKVEHTRFPDNSRFYADRVEAELVARRLNQQATEHQRQSDQASSKAT